MHSTDHPMRRGEREITQSEDLAAIFSEASVLFLALQDQAAPYVIPVSFGWEPGKLYFHGAREGRKLDLIRRNPHVGFSACGDMRIVTAAAAVCDFSVVGRSVVGTGKARILDEETERRHAMDVIVRHYSSAPLQGGYRNASLERASLIEIRIDTVRGKRMG